MATSKMPSAFCQNKVCDLLDKVLVQKGRACQMYEQSALMLKEMGSAQMVQKLQSCIHDEKRHIDTLVQHLEQLGTPCKAKIGAKQGQVMAKEPMNGQAAHVVDSLLKAERSMVELCDELLVTACGGDRATCDVAVQLLRDAVAHEKELRRLQDHLARTSPA